MKSVMFSINKPHTDNIKAGLKLSELRTYPPKLTEAYKAYIYETLKHGGCGAVIGEFTAINKERWRICAGIPSHLCANACITEAEIYKYSLGGIRDITEIAISDLVVYDKPKLLSEFYVACPGKKQVGKCDKCDKTVGKETVECDNGKVRLIHPPQNWCYVEVSK